jgi:hypothetical protein
MRLSVMGVLELVFILSGVVRLFRSGITLVCLQAPATPLTESMCLWAMSRAILDGQHTLSKTAKEVAPHMPRLMALENHSVSFVKLMELNLKWPTCVIATMDGLQKILFKFP